jgi:hypothetical protein
MAKKKLKLVSADPVTLESVIDIDGEILHLGASYLTGDWDRACELTGLGAGQLLQKVDREIDKLNGRKPEVE